jgi:hypothetical protein
VLQDILSDALSQAWTPAQEAILSNEAGMETVIDAVGRVNAAAQVLLHRTTSETAAQDVVYWELSMLHE